MNCAETPLICSAACEHANTRVQRMPAGHPHHAKEICCDCDAVLRWVPKPETLERRRLNAYRVAKLAMCGSLTTWERNFIQSVSQRAKLSPKQVAVIDRLVATYLGGCGV